jgi:hypothetical protein
MATKGEYESVEVAAARSVLVELMQILGEYREQMVLIGGWVPYFLYGSEHTGSTDIDIALDRELISEEVYRTIRAHLESRGYREGAQPYSFLRSTTVEGRGIVVQIDFLAGEYGGTGKSHRTQSVQDIRARKARGCELALKHHSKLRVDGTMPNGSANSIEVQLSEVVPFLVMKGMALYDRMKEKDAWDIWFCIVHFEGGAQALAEEIQSLLPNKLIEEGLQKIRSKFSTFDSTGPRHVVAFEEVADADERLRLQRDAFERVSTLLDLLNVSDYQESARRL